jgi:hypothetical protein
MKTFKQFIREEKEHPKGYEHHLKDEYDIADHISSTSTGHVDHGLMVDYFRGAHAKLKKTPIDSIKPGDAEHNIPNEKKQKKYAKMSSSTRPPIVVEYGKIIDGHHRYRDAMKKGESHIWVYHVEDK